MTYRLGGLTDNYLYGIRRFPYSTDMTANPLTWADVDDVTINMAGGIPPSPRNQSQSGALEVHSAGELWALSLWEVRSLVIAGTGGDVAAGNTTAPPRWLRRERCDLVRDLAYTRLAPPARQVLHAAVGQALEAIWAGRLEAVYDRLAFHFSRAEDADRAVDYLARFAEQAARSYAHGDAVHAVEEAVGWVDRLPSEDRDRRRLQLVLQQTSSLSFLGRFDEILDHLERERPRVERLQDAALSCAYFFRLALALNDLGDLTRSAAEAQRALADAERSGDEAIAGKARYILAQHAYYSGEHAAGVEHAWRAVALLGPKRHEAHWLGLAQWILGMNHLVLGEFPEALAAEAEAASIGHRNDDLRLQSFAASTAGWVHATRGDWHAGIEACRRGIELAPDPVSTALASARLGQAYLEQGLAADALRPLEEAIGLLVGCRFRAVNGHLTTLLGEAHLGVGRIESASELTARGLQITREAGYRYAVGWAMRALGRVRRAQADLADAEHHLAGALAVFAEIGARFEAARTRLDLAAIAQERGDPRSGAEHIADARRAFEALGVPWHPFERVHPPAECC